MNSYFGHLKNPIKLQSFCNTLFGVLVYLIKMIGNTEEQFFHNSSL